MGLEGVLVYNVSNVSEPCLVSVLNSSLKCSMTIELIEDMLIVGDNIFGLYFYDLTNIESIVQIAHHNSSDRIMDMTLCGDVLYVAEMAAGISIYNVSDRSKIGEVFIPSEYYYGENSFSIGASRQPHGGSNETYFDIADPWISFSFRTLVGEGGNERYVNCPVDVTLTSLFFYNDTNGDNKFTIRDITSDANTNYVMDQVVEDEVYFIAEFWEVRIDIYETDGEFQNGTQYYHCIYRVWNVTMTPDKGGGCFFGGTIPEDKKIGYSGKVNVTFDIWALIGNESEINNETTGTNVSIKINIIIDLYDLNFSRVGEYFNAFIGFNARINYDLVSYPAMSKIEGHDLPQYSLRVADQIGVLRILDRFSYTVDNSEVFYSNITVSNYYSWEDYLHTYERVSRTVMGLNLVNISTNATQIRYDPEIDITIKSKKSLQTTINTSTALTTTSITTSQPQTSNIFILATILIPAATVATTIIFIRRRKTKK